MPEQLQAMQPLAQPLAGRVALVTGVSRRIGLGFGIARRLAMNGADVFIQHHTAYDAEREWGADPDGIDAVLSELRAIATPNGTRIEHTHADFMDVDAAHAVVDAAVRAFGHVDILVCNHAYSTLGNLEEMTADQIDKHLLVNVRGSLLLTQAYAAQHDDSRAGGRVILLTSGQHRGQMSRELAYAASKGALHQLTESLSAHLIKRRITVNTINPGATDTGWADATLYEAIRAESPQGRWGEPDDAARLIAWLVSDDAQWITGQVINSTGGM